MRGPWPVRGLLLCLSLLSLTAVVYTSAQADLTADQADESALFVGLSSIDKGDLKAGAGLYVTAAVIAGLAMLALAGGAIVGGQSWPLPGNFLRNNTWLVAGAGVGLYGLFTAFQWIAGLTVQHAYGIDNNDASGGLHITMGLLLLAAGPLAALGAMVRRIAAGLGCLASVMSFVIAILAATDGAGGTFVAAQFFEAFAWMALSAWLITPATWQPWSMIAGMTLVMATSILHGISLFVDTEVHELAKLDGALATLGTGLILLAVARFITAAFALAMIVGRFWTPQIKTEQGWPEVQMID